MPTNPILLSLLVAAFEFLLEVLLGALADRFIRPWAGDLASELIKELAKELILVLLKKVILPWAARLLQRLKRWARSLRSK